MKKRNDTLDGGILHMKKILVILSVVGVVILGGAWGAKAYVTNKLANEVVKLTEDPEVKKTIDEAIAKAGLQNVPSSAGSDGNGAGQNVQFKNKEEVISYAASKFSTEDIINYANQYRNKENLTPEQKQAMKQDLLSRFSLEELKALQQAIQK
ncbi:hypothetical protein [Effusibacillus consociatus]|uniref:Uncharacterized protein n=1 Tax=Effusibacillus consociatus TaxID=1117041 RepID=A0ABV9Q7Y0_9BACL